MLTNGLQISAGETGNVLASREWEWRLADASMAGAAMSA